MEKTYGIVWRDGASPIHSGKLEVLPCAIRLEGRDGSREIPFARMTGIRVGRSTEDRINGHPSVVLEAREGPPVMISTVAQPSLVGEIAERLTALQLGASSSRRTAIVLPIKADSHAAVRALLRNGPPFDPAQLPGLDRHEVFLSGKEAIFVFDASLGDEALEALLAEPTLWSAAAAWRDHLDGPPRIAEDLYAWTRTESINGVTFLPTPGPGDSDGGDVFSVTSS